MNISIFSHCAIDSISLEGSTYEQIGGAACYCAMMARQFKFDVDLHTKFGADFPTQYFSDNKINYDNSLSQKPTTRFEIDISGIDRTLKLKHEIFLLLILMVLLSVPSIMKYPMMFIKK